MALLDTNGYKALWHPFDEHKLPYRLLYPYNYNPQQSYPLMIFTHGSSECGTNNTSQLGWSIATAYNVNTQSYQDWPCFVICPQAPSSDYYPLVQDNFEYGFYANGWSQVQRKSWYIHAVLNLISSILQPNFKFYNLGNIETVLTTEAVKGDYTQEGKVADVNINSDKIYCLGASLGGMACNSFAKEGRDIWAGIVNTLTFQFAVPKQDYYSVSSVYYNEEKALRFNREIERYAHIPMLLSTAPGDTYTGYQPVVGYSQALEDVSNRINQPNKSLFLNPGAIGHTTGVINKIFDKNLLFDPSVNTTQPYVSSGENYVCGMDWLFSKTKPETPTDPYPGEEENYYPERAYVYSAYSDTPYNGGKVFLTTSLKSEIWVRQSNFQFERIFFNGEKLTIIENGIPQYRLWNYNNKIYKIGFKTHCIF